MTHRLMDAADPVQDFEVLLLRLPHKHPVLPQGGRGGAEAEAAGQVRRGRRGDGAQSRGAWSSSSGSEYKANHSIDIAPIAQPWHYIPAYILQ